jgi:hypothetical protein
VRLGARRKSIQLDAVRALITGAIKWGDAISAFAQLKGLSGYTLWPSP